MRFVAARGCSNLHWARWLAVYGDQQGCRGSRRGRKVYLSMYKGWCNVAKDRTVGPETANDRAVKRDRASRATGSHI